MNSVSFIECNTNVPIIRFYLDNGTEAIGLIDTGSESSVFDLEFVKANKGSFNVQVTDSFVDLVGISKSNSTSVSSVYGTMPFRLSTDEDSKLHVMKAMILPLTHITSHLKENNDDFNVSAIFGSDMLTLLKAKLDFKNKVLIINNDLSCIE